MTAQLTIEDFSLVFRTRHGMVRALEDVSLSVERGEIVGVVGESGSGKSVMAYAVMGLQDRGGAGAGRAHHVRRPRHAVGHPNRRWPRCADANWR